MDTVKVKLKVQEGPPSWSDFRIRTRGQVKTRSLADVIVKGGEQLFKEEYKSKVDFDNLV